MMCSMCPSITITSARGPGKGWICPCGEANCSHCNVCSACHISRYWLEKHDCLKDGRPWRQADGGKAANV